MQPSRDEAERLVQQAVLGDLPADAPAVRAALAAFPDLADELRELTALGASLDALTDDAAEVEAAARADVRPGDVAALRRTAPPPPRRWPLLLAALLVCSGAFAVWQTRSEPAPIDGRLGPASEVTIDRAGATWSIDPGVPLPPGAEYVVTLETDGAAAFAPRSFPCPIQLPTAWQEAVDRATAAALVVELPELAVRRRIPLR